MCILSYIPEHVTLDVTAVDELLNGGVLNPDGYGWAIASDAGRIVTGRSLNLDTALDDYLDARDIHTGPSLFHSRYATHGSVTVANCHPFRVLGSADTVLAHNGILPRRYHPTDRDGDVSDTRVLATRGIRRYRRLDRANVRAALGQDIGSNKLVILTVAPRYRRRVYVINQHLGEWSSASGVWHSNADYRFGRRRGGSVYPPVIGYPAVTSNATAERCYLCDGELNGWQICTVCGTCADCDEYVADCLCYLDDTNASDDDADRLCPF